MTVGQWDNRMALHLVEMVCSYAVVDYSHNCVWIFDRLRQDQLVRKFGSTGTGNGQFSSPYGVAFDDNNYLYVTDCCDRVQKFKISSKYLLKFGTGETGNSQLSNPVGITIHNDKAYIAENDGDRISVFHCDGQFSQIIGLDHLDHPWYVAISNDHAVVSCRLWS